MTRSTLRKDTNNRRGKRHHQSPPNNLQPPIIPIPPKMHRKSFIKLRNAKLLTPYTTAVVSKPSSPTRKPKKTYKVVYITLAHSTNRLPNTLLLTSSSPIPAESTLLVPSVKTACINPIRITSGTALTAIHLSSRKTRIVRLYRPTTRHSIMNTQQAQHHHVTRSVGRSCSGVRLGGGKLYS